MTGQEYVVSIRKLHMKVYMFGKQVECPADDPILRPALNSVRATLTAALPQVRDAVPVQTVDEALLAP